MTIANSIILADNAYGTLASGLATGDTALAFTSGHGARFPAVAAGQVLNCCILNSSNVLEEVQITLHTAGSDSATMVRGANGTTAKAWSAGDRIEARVSSDVLKKLQQEALKEVAITTTDTGATYQGTPSPANLGYVSGMVYALTQIGTNQSAPTVNLNSLGAKIVKHLGGATLPAGDLPLRSLLQFDGTDLLLLNAKRGRFKSFSLTRDASAVSANIAYTGIGFRPKLAVFFQTIATLEISSWGFDDGTTAGCIYRFAAGAFQVTTSYSIFATDTGVNNQAGVVASFDADGFTIHWDKTLSPSGSMSVIAGLFG